MKKQLLFLQKKNSVLGSHCYSRASVYIYQMENFLYSCGQSSKFDGERQEAPTLTSSLKKGSVNCPWRSPFFSKTQHPVDWVYLAWCNQTAWGLKANPSVRTSRSSPRCEREQMKFKTIFVEKQEASIKSFKFCISWQAVTLCGTKSAQRRQCLLWFVTKFYLPKSITDLDCTWLTFEKNTINYLNHSQYPIKIQPTSPSITCLQ